MMLESMGIEVEAVQKLLDPKNVKELLSKIERMCNTVEATHMAVLMVQAKLGIMPESVAMELLADGESQAFKDAAEFVRDYNGNNGNRSGDNGSFAVEYATSNGNGKG